MTTDDNGMIHAADGRFDTKAQTEVEGGTTALGQDAKPTLRYVSDMAKDYLPVDGEVWSDDDLETRVSDLHRKKWAMDSAILQIERKVAGRAIAKEYPEVGSIEFSIDESDDDYIYFHSMTFLDKQGQELDGIDAEGVNEILDDAIGLTSRQGLLSDQDGRRGTFDVTELAAKWQGPATDEDGSPRASAL